MPPQDEIEIDDRDVRHRALRLAVDVSPTVTSAEQIVRDAEMFYAFLTQGHEVNHLTRTFTAMYNALKQDD